MRAATTPGQVGIGLAGKVTAADYTEIAEVAEAAGFDAITVFGDLMFQPPAMVLATMAAATSRIRLGVAAYSPWTHHPVEIAGQVAYLDMASRGRAFYGLVRGAWLDQLGIDQNRSIAAITRGGPALGIRAVSSKGAVADRHLERKACRLRSDRRRRNSSRWLGEPCDGRPASWPPV